MPASRASTLRFVVISLGFWTVFGVVSASQVYVRAWDDDLGPTPRRVFNILYFYWTWGLVTPLILAASNGLIAEARAFWARAARQLPWIVGILGLHAMVYSFLFSLDRKTSFATIPEAAVGVTVRHLAGNVLTYLCISTAFVLWRINRRRVERERESARGALRAAELEVLLAQARLESLRSQLQPHFLFNTLNMVSGLVAVRDSATANRVLARLGELLRASIEFRADQEIPLQRELELVRKYLEIAKLRMGDRLEITECVADTALEARIPALLLQPIVENALEHGLNRCNRGGRLEIEASIVDHHLLIDVIDDGPGFSTVDEPRQGLGLANVRARLEQLYGAAATMRTGSAPNGGARVTIRVPCTA